MTNKQARIAIFIGRFQPFHNSHLEAVRRAVDQAESVLFLLGSSNGARTPKNPWTFDERKDMILDTMHAHGMYHRVLGVQALADNSSDAEWVTSVQEIASEYIKALGITDDEVILVGHQKDASGFWLTTFPQWRFVDTGLVEPKIEATDIRDSFFTLDSNSQILISFHVPKAVFSYLWTWKHDNDSIYWQLVADHEFIKKYKKSWESSPYPPTFVTVDAVVVQSGHVLLVKRKHSPGKNLWAIPGGFVNISERIRTAAIRELIEETNINLQPQVLDRCIADVQVFDDPYRSQRGRTITHAHLFKLDDTKSLPKVTGGDDAAEAKWVTFADFQKNYQTIMFDDHFDIVTKMLRKLD